MSVHILFSFYPQRADIFRGDGASLVERRERERTIVSQLKPSDVIANKNGKLNLSEVWNVAPFL